MVCTKSIRDVGMAVFVMTLVIISSGCTLIGLIRYIYDLKDDQYISRDHLILAGNVIQVAAIGGVLVMLSSAQPGLMQLGLTMGMFFLLIMILYLTNYDPSVKGSAWTALVLLIIDMYVKVTAIFIGFGVCSVDQVPGTISSMATTLIGGRRRR
jgi:hypothetical protein